MAFPKKPLELYTFSVEQELSKAQWRRFISEQQCAYLHRKCIKTRKSEPDVTIGTCTVGYMGNPLIICPARFLQRRQIFLDALHLLEGHVPGNQLHVVPEITLPGGSVDFFLISTRRGEVKDYLALEIQTLDTTGTVWQARARMIQELTGEQALDAIDAGVVKSYAMNWKMTAKTVLVQMHHKVETLELLGKKLVLVIQDAFYDYITREFSTGSLRDAETADAAHFHVYNLGQMADKSFSIELASRHSTTTVGIEQILGLRKEAAVPESDLIVRLQAKVSAATLLQV